MLTKSIWYTYSQTIDRFAVQTGTQSNHEQDSTTHTGVKHNTIYHCKQLHGFSRNIYYLF